MERSLEQFVLVKIYIFALQIVSVHVHGKTVEQCMKKT